MSIQEHLNKIRNAVYGREVRESIAKGIETAYDDASEKDNANMEVRIARGTHPNLRSRLEEVDNKQQQTTTQLAQKANETEVFLKTHGININDLDEETRQTFLEAQGIDVNYVLGDNNVQPRNTTFFEPGKNLFDKNKASLKTGLSSTTGVTDTGGTLNDERFTTDFIEVEENTEYTKNLWGNTLVFYDANKDYISGMPATEPNAFTFTTPTNTEYIRASFEMTTIEEVQIEKGNRQTFYEPYVEKIPLRYQEAEKPTFFEPGKNLFDKTKVSLKTGLASATGITVTGGTYDVRITTDFIRIEPETDYVKNETDYTLVFYDVNKTYISGVGYTSTFTTPPNAVYLRTSFPMERLDDFQVEKGTESTDYEPYTEIIPLRYQERKEVETNDIKDKAVTIKKADFFTVGKNLFDKTKASLKTGLASATGITSTGGTYDNERFTTDFIEVEENTEYTKNLWGNTLVFYDANKDYISGMPATEPNAFTFTTPTNTEYIRASFEMTTIEEAQIEKGTESTDYEPYGETIKGDLIDGDAIPIKNVFTAEFTTTGIKNGINENNYQGLYLIATKKNNAKAMPVDEGYLYLDELEQKLYYSKNTFDNPEYLCDWDLELSGGLSCERFHATITGDGDIIFFRSPYGNTTRTNPIIYPSGSYDMPKVIDFGTETKPFGFAVDNGIEHHTEEDYFIFGEYRGWNVDDDDTPIYIWKVTKPYADPTSWRKVDMWYVRHYNSGPGPNPEREISHFHTANYDFYSGAWLTSTGDTQGMCRVIMSTDKGETWVDQQAGDANQMVRMVGFIFTKDAIYWQTDSTGTNHKLYKVGRDNNGYPDFSNIIKVSDLSSSGEAGYVTAYMRDPHGLLFIDRAEPRMDGLCDLYFYSLEFENLFHLGTFERVNGDQEGRHGLPPLAYTRYQSPYEDGIIMGATTRTKPFTLNILNNTEGNLHGVLKMKIVRVR